MESDDETIHDEEQAQKSERARLRKAVKRLGWKWVNRETVQIPCERTLRIGTRTVVVRGGVAVTIPTELTHEAGASAAEAIVAPTLELFTHTMEHIAARILSEPDDIEREHLFERGSFFSALEEARRALTQAYQFLQNRRVDARVEAELGLSFYIEGFTTAQRSFEYFVGPTNSGKTHAAIEALAEAQTGVYLAPLRLLALEIYERLNDMDVPASLITGEERIVRADAYHTSSTVEMLDTSREYDLAVIDEVQSLEDPQRGWAWTLAIAAVRARRVILCGSEEGLRAAQRLAARLNVTVSVRRFERKNPLRVTDAAQLRSLRTGDAVVAFSRRDVIELQGQIAGLGYTSAAIYGSLSPIVRRREAERFRNGDAAVLVATDAIGLGLNLPIRRIVFATIDKFDGVEERTLRPQEIRQIAGRAGRFGMHEEGLVTSVDPRDIGYLRRCIERADVQDYDGPIWMSPTDDHLRRLSTIIDTTRVGRLLQFFQERVLRTTEADLRIADLTEQIEVANTLEYNEAFLALPFEARATYSRAPVNTRGPSLPVLAEWGVQHATHGFVDGSELMEIGGSRDRLLQFEDRSRLATLYLWLAQRFPNAYTNHQEIARLRDSIDEDIHAALLQRGAQSRKVRVRSRHPQPRKRPASFTKRRR